MFFPSAPQQAEQPNPQLADELMRLCETGGLKVRGKTANPFTKYIPPTVRSIRYSITTNARTEVRGLVDEIYSQKVIDNFVLTIRYVGPVDIGMDVIIEKQLPNHFKNFATVRQQMGMESFSSCLSTYGICCRFFNTELDGEAAERLMQLHEKDLIAALRDADSIITSRLKLVAQRFPELAAQVAEQLAPPVISNQPVSVNPSDITTERSSLLPRPFAT